MKFTKQITVVDADGIEHVLPTRMEVCSRCQGHGTHVNENIDGNGITSEQMHDLGPEFFEDYMSGAYDVTCTKCHGANVVPVVDVGSCSKKLLALYEADLQAEYDYQRECAAERRAMGEY